MCTGLGDLLTCYNFTIFELPSFYCTLSTVGSLDVPLSNKVIKLLTFNFEYMLWSTITSITCIRLSMTQALILSIIGATLAVQQGPGTHMIQAELLQVGGVTWPSKPLFNSNIKIYFDISIQFSNTLFSTYGFVSFVCSYKCVHECVFVCGREEDPRKVSAPRPIEHLRIRTYT